MAFYVPLIYDPVTLQFKWIDNLGTDFIDPRVIPLSTAAGQILTRDTEGLLGRIDVGNLIPAPPEWSGLTVVNNYLNVDIPALISAKPDNKLTVWSAGDGRLLVDAAGFLNDDPTGSGLRLGTGDRLYVQVPDLISTMADNIVGMDAQNKIYASGTGLAGDTINYVNNKFEVNSQAILSDDPTNLSALDAQNRILTQYRIHATDQFMVVESDGGLRCYANLRFNNTAGRLEFLGKNNVVVSSVELPGSTGGIKSITVEIDPAGHPPGTYLVFVWTTDTGDQTVFINLTDLIPIYVSGNTGIDVTGQAISTRVDAAAGLTHNADGITVAAGYVMMTTNERNKLVTIEAGAQVNRVTSVNGMIGDVVLNKTHVGLGNVDNTADINKPVSNPQQLVFNTKQNVITGAASTGTVNNFTSGRAMVTDGSGKMAVSAVTSTELGYVSGATSNIQTQINTKQNTLTGATSNVTNTNLTAGRVVITGTNGKVAVSAVTSTELGYVSGATSNIQTQINTKQPTITGAATTITTANLASNRALMSNDAGKVVVSPVSAIELGYVSGVTSSIQTQLNGKQPTVTGAATTITAANLTANRVLVSNANGKVAISDITSTELSYLGNSRSNIQVQIDNLSDRIMPDYGKLSLVFKVTDINPVEYMVPDNFNTVTWTAADSDGATTGLIVNMKLAFAATNTNLVPSSSGVSLTSYRGRLVQFSCSGYATEATTASVLLTFNV